MAEVFFTIFLFIAITGITAVLFGGWVLLTVFRVLGRGLGLLFGSPGHVRPVTMRSPNMNLSQCLLQNVQPHRCPLLPAVRNASA